MREDATSGRYKVELLKCTLPEPYILYSANHASVSFSLNYTSEIQAETATNTVHRQVERVKTASNFVSAAFRMRRHFSAAPTGSRLSEAFRSLSIPNAVRFAFPSSRVAPPPLARIHPILATGANKLETVERLPSSIMGPPQRRQQNGNGPPQAQQPGGQNRAAFHAAAEAALRTSSTTKAHLTAVRFDSLSISEPTKRYPLHSLIPPPIPTLPTSYHPFNSSHMAHI